MRVYVVSLNKHQALAQLLQGLFFINLTLAQAELAYTVNSVDFKQHIFCFTFDVCVEP